MLNSYWFLIFDGFDNRITWTVSNVLMHGGGWICILIDFILSAERLYYKATIWPILCGIIYIFWGIIFEIAGWKNDRGYQYIYSTMDWSEGVVTPLTISLVSIFAAAVLTALATFIKNLILISSGYGQRCAQIKNNDENIRQNNDENTAENNDGKSVEMSIKISVNMVGEDHQDDDEDNYVLRTTSTRL